MKPFLFALFAVFAFATLSAQKTMWQPSPGHTQVPTSTDMAGGYT
jgi:hypothetical protein